MTDPDADDKPLSPEQAAIVRRVRWLMVISGIATMLGIAVVIGVIGYRVFRQERSAAPAGTAAPAASETPARPPRCWRSCPKEAPA